MAHIIFIYVKKIDDFISFIPLKKCIRRNVLKKIESIADITIKDHKFDPRNALWGLEPPKSLSNIVENFTHYKMAVDI